MSTVKTDEYGTIRYYNDARQLHREDGPAMEFADGYKAWFFNGKLHREDGPAIEDFNGDKHWYINGERHRTDGPAVEYAHGSKPKHWYQNDKRIK